MIYVFLLGMLFCSVSAQMDNFLIVHTNTTTTRFHYSYTTLGHPPKATLRANTIILSKHNFTDDCSFSPNLNKTILKDKIAIVQSLPEWLYCASTHEARPSAFARIFQREQGLGVVMLAHEKFYHGSVLAYDPKIGVPFIVLQKLQFDELTYIMNEIIAVEFPAISSKDEKLLFRLYVFYMLARIVICSLFLVVIGLFIFILYNDVKYGMKMATMNKHSIYLKVIAFVGSVVAMLCTLVDPFGFWGWSAWNSQFVMALYAALYAIVLMLVLQLWMVTTDNFTAKIVESKVFIYCTQHSYNGTGPGTCARMDKG
jgi:hypothetical protein